MWQSILSALAFNRVIPANAATARLAVGNIEAATNPYRLLMLNHRWTDC